MIFSAHDLARGCGGVLVAEAGPGRICTDTRKIGPENWFLALKGERFDAHDFLDTAQAAGAQGVIAERVPPNWSTGFVQVSDGLIALQNLARHTRAGFTGPVVGITGSAGKTTTRAMVGLVLSPLGPVHQTAGNLNNHIGLPLTVVDAEPDASSWVLEMGMNHAGEIDLLQEIGRPTVRLITNVGAAHLEGLGSIEAIARAKGELFDGAKPGDICCRNRDDPWVASLPIPAGVQTLDYGQEDTCPIRLEAVSVDPILLSTAVRIKTPSGTVEARFDSPGAHLALNATAAVAIAHALGIDATSIAPLLSQYQPVGMRLRVETGPDGIRVINDAYNANPMSMAASLRTLAEIPPTDSTRRIALLGDMLELGPTEIAQHRALLDLAESLDLDLIGLAGPLFGAAAAGTHLHAPTADELASLLRPQLRQGDIVLLKGSRGMAMERVLSRLSEETP